jgi:hypothetical protein
VRRPDREVCSVVVITRNFYITLALAACVLLVGGFLFRHSEIGSFATLALVFVGSISLLNILDDRERHRKERDAERTVDR